MRHDGPCGKDDHDLYMPHHSGNNGHYCPDWDGMYICDDCPEADVCFCDKGKKLNFFQRLWRSICPTNCI